MDLPIPQLVALSAAREARPQPDRDPFAPGPGEHYGPCFGPGDAAAAARFRNNGRG